MGALSSLKWTIIYTFTYFLQCRSSSGYRLIQSNHIITTTYIVCPYMYIRIMYGHEMSQNRDWDLYFTSLIFFQSRLLSIRTIVDITFTTECNNCSFLNRMSSFSISPIFFFSVRLPQFSFLVLSLPPYFLRWFPHLYTVSVEQWKMGKRRINITRQFSCWSFCNAASFFFHISTYIFLSIYSNLENNFMASYESSNV